MKRKKNYDKKVKLTRILLSDYLVLKELSQRAGVSMADALHKIITRQEDKMPISPAQIHMPVTMAESIPVTTTRRRSTPVTIGFSREVEHVNGHRQTD